MQVLSSLWLKPVVGKLKAFAEWGEGEGKDMVDTPGGRGRLLVSVKITIKDVNDLITLTGQFDWFLQMSQGKS